MREEKPGRGSTLRLAMSPWPCLLAVITKKVIMPAGLRDDELEVQVETEANQCIPFSIER